jgi:hypothetical protein
MTTNYDEKGKIFTDIVTKEAVKAKIQTTSHYIEGEIHIRPENRLKDELDLEEPFLAVTNASVFGPKLKFLFRTKFIGVCREQIVWVTAIKDLEKEDS